MGPGNPPESAASDVKQDFPLDYLCHCVKSTDKRFGSGDFKARLRSVEKTREAAVMPLMN